MSACEKYINLLMGLMDNELTPDEVNEIKNHLIKCKRCRDEYEDLRKTTNKINFVSFEEPQDAILKKIWKSPYSRLSRVSGFFLVLVGWLSLIVYSLFELLRNGEGPAFPRIAMAAIIFGFLVLLVTVIRERMQTYKSDPYKEVQR